MSRFLRNCWVLTDQVGIRIEDENQAVLEVISPERYIDIGFPGFFAGRKYLELPIAGGQVLLVDLDDGDLREFRAVIDEEIGRNFSHLLRSKLTFHRRIVYTGIAITIVGIGICVASFLFAVNFGFTVVFYGVPLAGMAMICASGSQIVRIKRIIANAGQSEASLK